MVTYYKLTAISVYILLAMLSVSGFMKKKLFSLDTSWFPWSIDSQKECIFLITSTELSIRGLIYCFHEIGGRNSIIFCVKVNTHILYIEKHWLIREKRIQDLQLVFLKKEMNLDPQICMFSWERCIYVWNISMEKGSILIFFFSEWTLFLSMTLPTTKKNIIYWYIR